MPPKKDFGSNIFPHLKNIPQWVFFFFNLSKPNWRFINSFITNHACNKLAPTAHPTQPFSSISFNPPTNHKPPLALSITELRQALWRIHNRDPNHLLLRGTLHTGTGLLLSTGQQSRYSRPINSTGEDIGRYFPKSWSRVNLSQNSLSLSPPLHIVYCSAQQSNKAGNINLNLRCN
ncbi:hypothetical protein CEXT_685591 [Caerostris extrusa]|uniref:Uncharacterized protein n=1 Tax=Caerostris extrusa TaxID=172846 RepID=A0AAV4RZL7_CAEEX|nr:hypothetical protein CEXT_685591 [Caerostris extrusa]